MKIKRSTKCSLKFTNNGKLNTLSKVLTEYSNVVNIFINEFWDVTPAKGELLKSIVDIPETWLSARLRKVAAREAISMVQAVKQRWKNEPDKITKPIHRGNRMDVSSTMASLKESKTNAFDSWLHLQSIGNKTILDLPIKFHKHINKLFEKGKRLESYIITKDYVQLCFEIDTGPKKEPSKCIGIDTGINALATLSTGKQLGTDIKEKIARIKRCKHGSKGQRKAVRDLKQTMSETARDVCNEASLVVIEDLRNITKNTKKKGKLGKKARYSIGRWNVSHWFNRLKMTCEQTNVSWRNVLPYYTSQTCNRCGYSNRKNRLLENFLCQKCSHTDNTDVNASKNILNRFLSGPYGAGCKPLIVDLST